MELNVVMTMLGCLATVVVGEKLHKVGNSQGWNQNVNYTLWSSSENFYVGDWLYFVFDKRYYNVLEVNKTSYENCNDRDFINNITKGGRDVVQLQEAKPYFFISGGGYCFHGMKLAVYVSDVARLAPEPAPAKNGSPFNKASWIFSTLSGFCWLLFLVLLLGHKQLLV